MVHKTQAFKQRNYYVGFIFANEASILQEFTAYKPSFISSKKEIVSTFPQ